MTIFEEIKALKSRLEELEKQKREIVLQESVSLLATEIVLAGNVYGTKDLNMAWGNVSIVCQDEEIKRLLVELAKRYLEFIDAENKKS